MSATIKCKAELQTEIVERVISELIAVLEPLDLDLEWDEEDPLSAFVKELVLVTEKAIKVEYPVGEVYCDDVDEYVYSIVQIFEKLKDDYPTIAILRGAVYVDDKYDEEYKHGMKFSCTEKDASLKTKSCSEFGDDDEDSVSSASEGDSVVVTISFMDMNGVKHILSLPSDVIERPINLNCWPEDFLSDISVENVFNILLNAIDGEGAEKCKKDIIAYRTEVEPKLENNGLSKLELIKTHDHKAPFFFGWLRANVINPEMKKLAKKVCTCAARNKQKNIDEFENYLNTFEPWFPSCEYTGWPEFCRYHVVDMGNGRYSFNRNPHDKVSIKLDWSCLANSVEEFARIICSKEVPREFAVERVGVDFEAGTTEQTAIYMPGGPKKENADVKALPDANKDNSPEPMEHNSCAGLTFVITGKVNVFKNRDAFIAYVEAQGGKVSGSVSKNTNFLVNNDAQSSSSKNKKAQELGIPIIPEEEFVTRYGCP